MASAVTLKKNYRCFRSLQQFYSGGPFSVSSDGSFIVCACDNTVKIVDSSNAAIKSTIEGDSEPVTALLLSPDDKLLFTAGHSRQIRVWDISSLKCLRSWKGHEGPVMGMACHASGGLLATAGSDKKVQVWDVDGGFCTHNFKGHKGVVTCIIFHPLRQLIFSGGDDSTVRVWDLTSKKCVKTLEKHQSTVTSIAISEDGWTLVTAGRDKLVNLWDLHDYSCSTTVPVYEAVESVCTFGSASSFALSLSSFTEENKKKKNKKSLSVPFVTVGERGIVRVWNSDGTILFEKHSSNLIDSLDQEEVKRGFTSVMMMPLGQGLLCATADQQFLIYNLEKSAGERLDLVLKKRLIGYNEEIVDMKFLGEEEQFLAVATSVEQVRIYDLASMSCSYVLTGHTDVVLCLDTCVEGSGKSLIVTGSKDNTVRLWDSQKQCCMGVGIGHMGAVGAIAFSKKSRDFFVSGSSDRTLKVWSLDAVSDSAGDVYNLKSKAVVAAHDKDINSLAIAPNDSLVCSGSQDRTAAIWRLPDLVSVVVLRGHKRGIWSVEFSPVDQCVITASGDKTIKIWAISDGSCLKTFEGHLSSVTRASFITRGTQFVSCGADGLLKLWTVKTDECLATYDQHEDKIWTLAIGKQTELLATGGGDAVINLWRDSTSEEMEEAFRKEEEDVLRGQELDNAVSDSDYSRAIHLAFELRRPHKLFEIFTEICRKSEADVHIDRALLLLGNEQLRLLMEYIRDWNTKPKLCYTAQRVLQRVYLTIPAEDFDKISGITDLLNVINAYTKRHYDRLRRYGISCHLPGIILARKSVVQPEEDETESRNVGLKGIEKGTHNPTEVAGENKSRDNELEPKDESVKKKKRKLPTSEQRKEKKRKDA